VSYNVVPAFQRRTLSRLADSVGVLTYRTVGNKRVCLRYNEIRLRLHDRLIGPNLPIALTGTTGQVDAMLSRMVDTAKGKHGHALRMSQYHLRKGKEAFAEAQRLWALPSRPHKRIMADLAQAKKHYTQAGDFQDQHAAAERREPR